MLNEAEKKFIDAHKGTPPEKLYLKFHNKKDLNYPFLIQQIAAISKVKDKFQKLSKNENLIYPPTENLEQSSSEITANYKAQIVHGKIGADLTGGFGIDTIFLSKKFEKFHYIEPQKNIFDIAVHNFEVLKLKNIKTVNTTAENFLKLIPETIDFIYLDPSRRTEDGSRVILLQDYSPSVPNLLKELKNKSKNILLKTSPMLDIYAVLKLLNTAEVHILAVKNEVKETLYYFGKDVNKTTFKTVNFSAKTQLFDFDSDEEKSAKPIYSDPLIYIYEPNAAIMKSGCFNLISKKFNLYKLHKNSHLYTSVKLVENFPGRIFSIENITPKPSIIKKANLALRNYPSDVKEVQKKYKISSGGDIYLFGTTLINEKPVFLICKKIN